MTQECQLAGGAADNAYNCKNVDRSATFDGLAHL